MKTSFNWFRIAILSVPTIFLVVTDRGLSEQVQLVSPSRFAESESKIDLPPIPGSGASRAQFLFEAADFSSLSGPHWITQFAWRPDGRQTNRTVSVTSERVVFRMSTTDRTVRNMSMTYADNIGADQQVVARLDDPQTTTVTVAGPAGGPKEFTLGGDIIPFRYDPSQGNLLLDMQLFGGSPLPADNIATPASSLTTKWIAGPLNARRAFKQFGGIITQFTFVPVIDGDFGKNGQLDVEDILLLSAQIQSNDADLEFDLDGDADVTPADLKFWVNDLQSSWIGDSNLDGQFDSGDLVNVFKAGEYEDGIEGNSTWATGDWNGDGDFDSGDLVFAFKDGGIEAGPRVAVNEVPEPGAFGIALLASLGICRMGLRRR